MLGNNKMDLEQLNKCIRGYHFLSPRLNTSCFSNYTPKTDSCNLKLNASNTFSVTVTGSRSINDNHNVNTAAVSTPNSPVWRMSNHWRASCEGVTETPSATAKIEEASKQMHLSTKQGQGQSTIMSEVEVQEYLAKETGRDRLAKMFSKDHLNEVSPEIKFIKQVTLQSAGVTFLVMSALSGRQAKMEFIDRNKATVFRTRFQAFRRLHDVVFLYSMKEGAKWTLRVSLFSAAFLGISQSIAVYRNKSTPWEYCISAATIIGAMKINMGLRGFLVGTGFGAVMGLCMGLIAYGAMKLTNETQEQRHYWQITRELEKERLISSIAKRGIKTLEPPDLQPQPPDALPQTA